MMSKQNIYLWLMFILLAGSFMSLSAPELSAAAIESDNPGKTGVFHDGNQAILETTSAAPEEAKALPKQQAHKQPVVDKEKIQNVDETDSAEDVPEKDLEVEQDIMERALELLNASQDSWVKGDVEGALESLDQAYAILLDTNGDPEIARQKDDLRLLISKKILAIYTSRQSVTVGRRSEIPLVMNEEVEREIRSFQTVERDYFVKAYQRSAIFRPTLVASLKKAGLPEELSWLPLVESGFKIRALSPARALGLWQFIPSTGYKYGLNRNEWVDERMDAEKSTQAAIGYLKDLHAMFGDWLTVLAAYNCGEGRVLRIISGQHIEYLDRFWDLYNKLPRETARYVPRFLATLHIIKDPQKYGMNLELPAENQLEYAYGTVKTNKIMKLGDIAACLGVSEEQLCLLNAELRVNKTPDKEYNLKLPPASLDKFSEMVDSIPLAERPRNDELSRQSIVTHRVKRGETLSSIARKYRTTVSALRQQNRILAKRKLRAGQSLVIATRNSSRDNVSRNGQTKASKNSAIRYRVKQGDTLFSLAKRFDTSVDDIRRRNRIKGSVLKVGQLLFVEKNYSLKSGSAKIGSGANVYVVKKGDNLALIARGNGSNVDKLRKLNDLSNDVIVPGQVIVLK